MFIPSRLFARGGTVLSHSAICVASPLPPGSQKFLTSGERKGLEASLLTLSSERVTSINLNVSSCFSSSSSSGSGGVSSLFLKMLPMWTLFRLDLERNGMEEETRPTFLAGTARGTGGLWAMALPTLSRGLALVSSTGCGVGVEGAKEVDVEGVDTEEAEAEGMDTEEAEAEGVDAEGVDAERPDTEGPDTEGLDADVTLDGCSEALASCVRGGRAGFERVSVPKRDELDRAKAVCSTVSGIPCRHEDVTNRFFLRGAAWLRGVGRVVHLLSELYSRLPPPMATP